MELAIDRIKESGLNDRSVIIMNSDHGYPDPSRGMNPQWFKREKLSHDLVLSDDNIRVPLYIRHPELTPRLVKTPVCTIDIMPTALELLGVSLEPTETPMMLGRSLVPLLRNETAPELENRMFRTDARYLRQTNRRTSIRSDHYKYVFNHDGDVEEFYDLDEDSMEHNNIISNSDLAQTIEQHRKEFKRTEDTAVRFHLQDLLSQNRYLADEAEEINKALGCVDIWCIMDTCQRLNYAMNNGRKSLNFCAHAQTSTLERRTIAGATSRPSCGWHEVVLLGDCCLSTTVTGTAYISASHAGVKRVYGNECISILCKTPIWSMSSLIAL